jgi:hypothetical protein
MVSSFVLVYKGFALMLKSLEHLFKGSRGCIYRFFRERELIVEYSREVLYSRLITDKYYSKCFVLITNLH